MKRQAPDSMTAVWYGMIPDRSFRIRGMYDTLPAARAGVTFPISHARPVDATLSIFRSPFSG